MSRLLSVCTQLSACGLEADEDDVAGHSAAGAALAMLKDYSDFFDAMTAAASVTENALMQPFVAWCVEPSALLNHHHRMCMRLRKVQ